MIGAQPHLAPKTVQLLQKYCADSVLSLAEAGGGEVILSVLAPHTHIRPHTASTNLRLTAHLGLLVPPQDCRIRIADEWHTWQVGQMLVFDDSFEHEVVNESDSIRGVLLLRFWHDGFVKPKRQQALERALQSKQFDELRRYNPPGPTSSKQWHNRAMQTGSCQRCWGSGYESIRVDPDNECFLCTCGEPIG